MSLISKICTSLIIFIIIFFSYFALKTTPTDLGEVDSLRYHIPVAASFSRGEIVNLSSVEQGLGFYPGVGELILSSFFKFGLPLGLYNLLSLSLLFFLLKELGKRFGLDKAVSVVFSASIVTFPSIVRLVPHQQSDIWVAVFFTWSLLLLKRPSRNKRYFLSLGTALGFLIGSKYSGILIALALAIVYYKDLVKYVDIKRIIVLLAPIFLFGGFWYFRNYILFSNPFYPTYLFSFPGDPGFAVINWDYLIKVLFTKEGLFLIIQAFLSEFLLWALVTFLVIYYFVKNRKVGEYDNLKQVGTLSLLTFLALTPQPVWYTYQSAVSQMRFFYSFMITIVLSAFLIAKRKGVLIPLSFLAILSAMSFLPQLSYHPKVVAIWIFVVAFIFFRKQIQEFFLK